jgi:hypothetical protein
MPEAPSPILRQIRERNQAQRGKSAKDASDFIYMSIDEMFDTPYAEVKATQLSTLQQRFETMRSAVAPLQQLATRQGIDRINSIEDAAPLLFGPKVLKSYPLSLLENNQFDKLTEWLGRLTTHDLSSVDVSGCDTIDAWLDKLEAQTPLRVMHSSGTSGKLSIIPRSVTEMAHLVEIWFKYLDGYKDDRYGDDIRALGGTVPMFLPTYRHGRHIQRPLGIAYPEICGTEDQFICAFPGKLSADLLTLGGRLAAAEAKGEAGQLSLNPGLLAKRDELIEFQKRQPEYLDDFFKRMLDFKGRRVFVAGTWSTHLMATLAGEERGASHLFASNSFPIAGGGKKGQAFPDDWYERICRFYGMREMRANYGMVEMTGLMQQCREGHYHPWPHQIPYLLDLADGTPLLREGTQRGRFGFMDLSAETYWGGGLSGDLVTIAWDTPCACGRQGPYVEPSIERLSERDGGDDKISCAGAQAAHDAALDFLTKL